MQPTTILKHVSNSKQSQQLWSLCQGNFWLKCTQATADHQLENSYEHYETNIEMQILHDKSEN